MIGKRKNYRMISMLAAIFIGAMFISSSMAVLAASADEEPNDSLADAVECYNGDYITGSLDEASDPQDYYKIQLYEGDAISLSLSMSGYNFDMFLYDPSETIVESSDTSDYYGSIYHYASDSGYYYILVVTPSDVGDYYLSISVTEGGGGPQELYVGGDYHVSGDPLAELPVLTVGDGTYWGGVKDFGEEFKQEIEDGLQEVESYGVDANIDVNGGAGAYFGIEVAGDDSNIDGVTCYDIAITGALAVDVGISGSVDGSVSEEGYSMTVDGSGNGFVVLEVNLEGHVYLTVDELAIAKITLELTAEGRGEVHLDADMSMSGYPSQSIEADAEMSIEDVQIDFDLTFDPPLDIFQFGTGNGDQGIYEGKTWYVPGYDTTVSGSLNAQGTISYDVYAVIPGEPAMDESNTTDLATEIGSETFSQVIPGGEYDYWDGGGTMFTCTKASGDIFVIETDMGSAFGMMDYGTRQLDMMDPTSMMPSTGMQYNGQSGMITGMTMDGEPMTEEVTAAEVEDFTQDPLSEVKSETGGHSSGLDAGLLGVILIGVIIVVVVIVVVVMMTKKKPPQQYPPQQQYQQPPPPPPEYQPQEPQYQQPPDQQSPPPPPPQQ